MEGGADLLLIETGFDTRNVKAGLLAVQKLERETGHAHSADGLRHHRALGSDAGRATGRCVLRFARPGGSCSSIGLNCATGPDLMTDHIRTLAEMASTRISCYPNAGLPNEEDKYLETPESLAKQLG